mmetsp:Transcript_8455/g.25633  ORF Transcript_8455/g.25633 Transcript_8455/m.25633 type:complete len:255 (+) Transcript_8455:355-1119(+)
MAVESPCLPKPTAHSWFQRNSSSQSSVSASSDAGVARSCGSLETGPAQNTGPGWSSSCRKCNVAAKSSNEACASAGHPFTTCSATSSGIRSSCVRKLTGLPRVFRVADAACAAVLAAPLPCGGGPALPRRLNEEPVSAVPARNDPRLGACGKAPTATPFPPCASAATAFWSFSTSSAFLPRAGRPRAFSLSLSSTTLIFEKSSLSEGPASSCFCAVSSGWGGGGGGVGGGGPGGEGGASAAAPESFSCFCVTTG